MGVYNNNDGTWATDVAVSGCCAYLTTQYGGVKVIDISNPINPIKVGYYNLPPYAASISIIGSYAYVAEWSGGLFVLNFTGVPTTYSISGRVTDNGNNPISSVTISVSPTLTTTTNASGYYTFTNFITGTYTITPSMIGYTFSPPSRTVTVPPDATGQDFTAPALTYFTSGTISGDSSCISTVSVSDGAGHTATTDGSGNYTLNGLPAGTYTLTASKSGCSFSASFTQPVTVPPNATGKNFAGISVSLTQITPEARKDIGMPYPDSPYHRGCPSDYSGCGGPYHGFYLGVCTDLVVDAYNAGASFNVQNSLYQDFVSNPGRYSWGSARNADDMRRYFIYNQQFLPDSQAYQAGDIAFFSWDGGPITDHVLIVSQVDAYGRPLSMVDASGTYSGNPSGLAFEHSWSSYYSQHVQGHGRLTSSGLKPRNTPSMATSQVLNIMVDSSSVALSLTDSNGKSTSSIYDESLVASNNDAFIPYIPGGAFANVGSSQVISVTQPLSNTAQYIAQITGNANTLYHLTIQTLQNGSQTAISTFTQTISSGETQGVSLQLSAPGGVITFSASSPGSLPNVKVTPSPIEMSGLPSGSINTSVSVNETSNRQALNGAVVSIGDLMNQAGQTIPGPSFQVTPLSFDVAAGGSQNVQLQINLSNISPGVYLGNLIITSTNNGVQSIPLSLKVDAYNLNLPLIMR